MLTLGSYTTGRSLAGAGFCARFEAALSAQASVGGVKPFGRQFLATAIAPSVVAPWLPRAGIDEEARRLVGAARDQAQLVGAGAKRWSIIADFGLLDDGRGAFVVRPVQAWSVERLALARYDIASVELRAIVLGVLEGLIELEKFSARPWGNLHSATVLLTVGPGDAKFGDPAAVILTDLESRERLAEDAHLDDLRALGRLIYEIVLHKRPPLKSSTGWSATWSDGWEGVGDGRFWFNLANRLMTAGTAIGSASGEIARPPSLSQLRLEVLEHKPFKPLPKRQIMIAGAVAAVIALSAGGYFAFRTPPREQIVLSADQLEEAARLSRWQGLIDHWYGYFASLYADREKVAALAATQPPTSTIRSIAALLHDPALRDPREIANSSAGLLDLRDNPGDAIGGDKIVAASATLDKIEEVRARLLVWPELANLSAVKQAWDSRGWSAAAAPFLDVSRSVATAIPAIAQRRSNQADGNSDPGRVAEPDQSRPPAPDDGRVLRAVLDAQSLLATVAQIEARYEAIQKVASDAKARGADAGASGGGAQSGDPTLTRLPEILYSETKAALQPDSTPAASPLNPDAALAALDAVTAALAHSAAEAASFDSGAIAGWDRTGFRAASKPLGVQPANAALLHTWLAEARKADYARVDAPDPREPVLAAARAAVEDAKSQRERLAGLAAANRELTMQPSELDTRLAGVEDAIGRLAATAWSNRNRTTVERLCRELAGDSSALARDASDAVTTGTVPLAEALRLLNRSEFASPALANVWGDAIDRAQASKSKREAFANLRETREALGTLDRAVPLRLPPPQTTRALRSFDDAAWDAAARAARERAFTRTLIDAPIGSRSDADRVALVTDAMNLWQTQAHAYLEACVRARDAMLRADELSDPALAAAAGVIESSPLGGELARVLPVVSDGVLALQAVKRESDPARIHALLTAALSTPTDASASIALSAWARLASADWPRTAAELGQASLLLSREMPALIDRSVEPDSRSRAAERLRAGGRELWSSFMNTRKGADRTEIDAAMRDAGLFGIDPERAALSKPATYNARLWLLSRRAEELSESATSTSVAALAEQTRAAADFLAQIRSLASDLGVATMPAVGTLIARLEVISQREARPPFDPLVHGPASIRSPSGRPVWRADRQGEAVVYTLDSGAIRLAAPIQMVFLPVDIKGLDGPIPTYVLAGEVSVGLFIALAESTDSWSQFAGTREGQRALYWWDFDQGDPRSGPTAWQWDRRRAKVVLSDRPAGNAWLIGVESMGQNRYYPDALADLAPPALDSPMNDVSPDAALLVARLAGARIPSVVEWKAAVAAAGGLEAATKGANRRDRTWKLQFDHVNSLDATIRREWPHAGIFWPRSLRPEWPVNDKNLYLYSRDDSALDVSDGVLWFAGSAHDSPNWSHLVGNVAEFVLDANADSLADVEPEFPAVRAAIDRTVEKWSVIGGSALSALTLRGGTPAQLDQPYAIPSIREARMGYSDVGFRLAFSEGGIGRPKEPPAVLAARAFDQAAYLDAK